MAEHFQQQHFNDIQTKFASSDLKQRLTALSECLKFDQGLDLLAQQALTDSSEQVQQSAYWVLYGDNPYLTESVNPKSPNVLAHDTISCVAISSEHKIIVGGSWKKIRIWNLNTGELAHTLDAHSHWVLSVAISSDGQYLFSSSIDKTVKIWSLKTKNILHTFTEHESWVNVVKITPDNKKLISGSADKTIKVWDLDSKKLIHTFNGHTGWVSSLAVSSDSQVLVSGSTDKTIKLWDLTNQSLLRTLEGHSDWVKAVAISSEHQSLITGSRDGVIKIWEKDPNTSAEKFNIPLGYILVWIISAILAKFTGGTTLTIPFLTQGFFFGESKNKSNFKSNVNTLNCVKTISKRFKTLTGFDISPNGNIQVIGSQTGSIYIKNSNQTNAIIDHSGFISSIAVSSNSKRFVSGGRDWIKIWDLQTGKYLYPLTGDSPKLKSLKISPAYKTLYCGEYQEFKVQGFDQYNKPIEIEKITWTATGGEIEDGLFQAGYSSGSNFNIQATVNLISCKASITILEKPQLKYLKISPDCKSIYCGEHQQFTVQGFDQYNKPIEIGQATWTATGGEIKNGLFQAGNISGSSFTVQAQADQVSCKISITILEKPQLKYLKISPDYQALYCEEYQQFTVQGFDQYNKPIEIEKVIWTATGGEIEDGLFQAGNIPGSSFTVQGQVDQVSCKISIIILEKPKLASLEISPSEAILYCGDSQKFSVEGFDQYNKPIEIGQVTWTANNIKLPNNGMFIVGDFEETVTIRATIEKISQSVQVKVIERPKLTSLSIEPKSIVMSPNQRHEFTVQGLDQRGNPISVGKVNWTQTGGEINNDGHYTVSFYSQGEYTVTASIPGQTISATAKVIVPSILTDLIILPNTISVEPNEPITFEVMGLNQVGNWIWVENVQWKCTPGGRINSEGVFRGGYEESQVIVTAKVNSIEASATVNLLPVLRQINIYPNQDSFIKPNESITFKAIGYDQYGNEIETGNIFWEAPGKRIDQKGIFTAYDNDKGFYKVTAKVSSLSPYDIRSKILTFGIYTKLLARSIKLAERLFSLSDTIQKLLNSSNLDTELQNKPAKTDNIFDNFGSDSDSDYSEEISNVEVDFQAWVIKQTIKMSVRILDWVGESCINFAQISDSVNVNVIPVLRKLKIQPEQVELKPNQGFQFKVTGFDQQGDFIIPNYIEWDATGGTIDHKGYFVPSPDSGGSYEIYAEAIPENISDLVEVKVVPVEQEDVDISSKFIDRNLGKNSLADNDSDFNQDSYKEHSIYQVDLDDSNNNFLYSRHSRQLNTVDYRFTRSRRHYESNHWFYRSQLFYDGYSLNDVGSYEDYLNYQDTRSLFEYLISDD
ncbi:putative WD repeat-containing protein alr3466 [Planktothrix tepida]|uniref:Putative WD40 repeat-containing protein n=1 Tax=Planktothrix tepida PCC 9214 TaxID=671072 RepID=A0A1J1LTT5_9CYAN|nr:hypothetical protein [Planktothrix tepida]CAD5990131.1 putative WD repeat-containing protein alr3466 [Planktothrix tepida]CUR35622.1 putative WD40 repeat-containing protein [Planktothrix tepida PCC 9214]